MALGGFGTEGLGLGLDNNLNSLNHLALERASLEGYIPGPMVKVLKILSLMIAILLGFSKMWLVIIASQVEHTSVHLRRVVRLS